MIFEILALDINLICVYNIPFKSCGSEIVMFF